MFWITIFQIIDLLYFQIDLNGAQESDFDKEDTSYILRAKMLHRDNGRYFHKMDKLLLYL